MVKLISLSTAVWAVSAATSLISNLIELHDRETSSMSDKLILGQVITLLRCFSSFIKTEQESLINETIQDFPLDIEEGNLNTLADVATVFSQMGEK